MIISLKIVFNVTHIRKNFGYSFLHCIHLVLLTISNSQYGSPVPIFIAYYQFKIKKGQAQIRQFEVCDKLCVSYLALLKALVCTVPENIVTQWEILFYIISSDFYGDFRIASYSTQIQEKWVLRIPTFFAVGTCTSMNIFCKQV